MVFLASANPPGLYFTKPGRPTPGKYAGVWQPSRPVSQDEERDLESRLTQTAAEEDTASSGRMRTRQTPPDAAPDDEQWASAPAKAGRPHRA